MDYRFSPEDEAFRQEVRSFLKDEWHPVPYRQYGGIAADMELPEIQAVTKEFTKKLVDKGWYTMAWPEEWGGDDAPPGRQIVYAEELAYAGAPQGSPAGNITGAVMIHGSDRLKKEFLPQMGAGEIEWAQGFSEPNAGTDLASLETRAVRDGDSYVISGQKIWTSGAYRANWGHFLVRTDPDAPKHRGISYLVADMKTPGITLRPLYDMLGRHYWSEVFLDEVRVPADNMLGEENRGWYAAMTTLSFERSNIQGPANLLRVLEDFQDFSRSMRRRTGSSALDSAVFRSELANLRIEIETLRMLSYRVAWMQSQGQIPQKEASMTKLWGDQQNQRVYKTLSRGLQDYGNLLPYNKFPGPLGGFLNNRAFSSVTLSIAGGTTEVQRGIIAQRGLGLPR